LALWLVLFCAAVLANAEIVYTESETASGSLGGTSFKNSLITLTFTEDAGNVTGGSGFFVNTVGMLTVNIASLGTATFNDAVQAFDDQNTTTAGFGDTTQGSLILGTYNGVFGGYDLKTSIGPITESIILVSGGSFPTNQGTFIINSNSVGNSTFTA
jgi:hypothetical protein